MFNGLPEIAFTTNEITGKVIKIVRGERGYYPVNTTLTADQLNEILGVTKPQEQAMVFGSMLGWELPAADPLNYDDNGKLKVKKQINKE